MKTFLCLSLILFSVPALACGLFPQNREQDISRFCEQTHPENDKCAHSLKTSLSESSIHSVKARNWKSELLVADFIWFQAND